MAESYRRVDKPQETLPANEIRVRRGVGIGRYLKRAWDLLNGAEGQDDTVVIKGVSNAVQSAVNLAELIKHRVKGLHQINKISNITIVDEFEPLVEGLDHLKFSRVVTMLQITLTKSENVDKSDIGYQPPIPESEVQEYNERERVDDNRKGDRRGRGGRGGDRGGRPRGRGRGRGGRGLNAGFRGGRGDRNDGRNNENHGDREERKQDDDKRRRGGPGRPRSRRNDDDQTGDRRDNRDRDNRDNRDVRDNRDHKKRDDYNDRRGGDDRPRPRREYDDQRQRRPDYDGERPRRGGRGGGNRGSRGGRGGGDRGGRGGGDNRDKATSGGRD